MPPSPHPDVQGGHHGHAAEELEHKDNIMQQIKNGGSRTTTIQFQGKISRCYGTGRRHSLTQKTADHHQRQRSIVQVAMDEISFSIGLFGDHQQITGTNF